MSLHTPDKRSSDTAGVFGEPDSSLPASAALPPLGIPVSFHASQVTPHLPQSPSASAPVLPSDRDDSLRSLLAHPAHAPTSSVYEEVTLRPQSHSAKSAGANAGNHGADPGPSDSSKAFRSSSASNSGTVSGSGALPLASLPLARFLYEHEGALWLTIWFCLNIFVTLLNKAAFQFFDFNYPITLSFVHMVSSLAGSSLSLASDKSAQTSEYAASKRDYTTLVLFSILFCSNIIVGNSSLRYVSVSLVQIIRSTIPAITIVLSMMLLGKTYKREHFWSLCPIVAGVCLASLGEIDFHMWGFMLTVLVCLLSSLKTVLSNKFLVGPNKLPPMEFLRLMSFYSCIQMIPFIWMSGEFDRMRLYWTPTTSSVFWIFLSGFLAFFLNHANFMTNKATSPLAVTVAGNVKHVTTIILSVIFFDASMTFLKGVGTIITVCGGAWYSSIEYQESQNRKKVKTENDPPKARTPV